MKKYLIVVLFFSLGSLLFGQANKYLSDFDYFIENLIETHPDPYSGFGGRIEFYREKEKTKSEISDSITKDEFIILVNQFLSNLNDGHTYLYFDETKNEEQRSFPLQFKISSDNIFINNTPSKYKNLIGKPIFAINDVVLRKWLLKVKSFLPSENVSGEYYNSIKIIEDYQLAKKFFGNSDTLKLTFDNGESMQIPYLSQVKYLENPSQIEFENDNGLLYSSMIGKSKDIGYLAWNSILSREALENVYKNSPDQMERNLSWAYSYLREKRTGDNEKDIAKIPSLYEQFYKLSEEMREKKSTYLIIDLRENNGGMTPIVRPLLYILYGDKYLNFDFNAVMVRRVSPLYLQKIGFESIDDFNKLHDSDFKLGDYTFSSFGNVNQNLSLEQKRKELQNGYNGFGKEYLKKIKPMTNVEIFVLCSPKTFSAAYHFTYFLKKLGRTKIVGIASRQAGNSFMETTNIILPETGIKGSISNSKQILFKKDSLSAKILKPDYRITWKNFEEHDFDKNAEILKTLELIESK
ncbi:MAG: S41 family peptidase [Petrimonas sp.]|nr:S41 family peptidase [Petrimonas sp.]